MGSVCFYFQVHQPYRIKPSYNFFSIGQNHDYFDDGLNEMVIKRVAKKCYLPANKMMLDLIEKYDFSLAYSLSGVFLEQCQKWAPDVIESFADLYATGKVEFLAETYHHSLAQVFSSQEFDEQIDLHAKMLKKLFGAKATVFRNTELIYSNAMAKHLEKRKFIGILTEGADSILQWRNANVVYQTQTSDPTALLLKNYKLSDDIAFRFVEDNQPLKVEDYIKSLEYCFNNGDIVNLFMDYETFGEHQWLETGIFDFFKDLIATLDKKNIGLLGPSAIIKKYSPVAKINVENAISWADKNRDLSPWLGNPLQNSATQFAFELEGAIRESKNKKLLNDWQKLLTSDHFYYMSTKGDGDGEVHRYFSPFSTPHDAYVVYTNVLNDLSMRLEDEGIVIPDLRFGWSK